MFDLPDCCYRALHFNSCTQTQVKSLVENHMQKESYITCKCANVADYTLLVPLLNLQGSVIIYNV